MNIYALSSIVAFSISFALSSFVCLRGIHDKRRIAMVQVILGTGSWSLFPFLACIGWPDKSLFLTRLIYIAALATGPAFLNFGLTILDIENDFKEQILLKVSLFFPLLVFLPFIFSDFFIKDVRMLGSSFSIVGGWLYVIFILYFGIVCLYCFYKLYGAIRTSSGSRRNQLRYVFTGFLLAFLGGLMHFSSSFGLPELFPHDFLIVACMLSLTYSIIRHHLMDIKVVLTRAGIFIVVYTLILGIPFWVGFKYIGKGRWMLPVSVAGFLATLGPFLYIFIDRRAEARLFKEQKRYQQTLRQASMGMTRIRDLRRLLDLIAHIVTKTVRISYVGIYLFSEENNEYVLQVCRDKGRIPVEKLAADNPLVVWLSKNRKSLIYDEIKRQLEETKNFAYAPIVENIHKLSGNLIIPNFLEDKLLAFFVLGEKVSGQIYTNEDIAVFEVLASQAALAIENARFFEETKQMQEQIAQAEKMATVGTMADGLSHQINNRFYALLLIAGNTIDTIKTTDTSKCSPEMQAMFNEVNHALERIKENVVQGGEVVKGLLKYTRKSDEGFEELTLDKILDDALSMAQYKIKLPEFDIIRDYPKELPRIRGNAVQLQEVFFNFFDNAYDAIVERRTFLKEEGYRGRIVISAQANTKFVAVSFADNGMGIKHEALKKMFTPFFTTKTSARKGTGLGLYVIKRIVEDFHKGTIAFESTHHFGTTFTLQLPMAT